MPLQSQIFQDMNQLLIKVVSFMSLVKRGYRGSASTKAPKYFSRALEKHDLKKKLYSRDNFIVPRETRTWFITLRLGRCIRII